MVPDSAERAARAAIKLASQLQVPLNTVLRALSERRLSSGRRRDQPSDCVTSVKWSTQSCLVSEWTRVVDQAVVHGCLDCPVAGALENDVADIRWTSFGLPRWEIECGFRGCAEKEEVDMVRTGGW